jgi:hypothetical protein
MDPRSSFNIIGEFDSGLNTLVSTKLPFLANFEQYLNVLSGF